MSTDGSNPGSNPEEAAVETFVEVEVEIERVWRALVSDGGLEPWMGEGATIDARPDGWLAVPDVVGGRPRHGRVERVEPGRELAFTWWPTDRPTERSAVRIAVDPTEDGTRITVVETPLRRTQPGFQVTASAGTPTAVAGSAAASLAAPGPVARSRSMIGAWSWRLAVLALASQAVRI